MEFVSYSVSAIHTLSAVYYTSVCSLKYYLFIYLSNVSVLSFLLLLFNLPVISHSTMHIH